MKTVSIIGTGAAGLMTAATILESKLPCQGGIKGGHDFHIYLFDKNRSPGKKVIISGGGRCNLTTGIEDKKILLSKYTRGSEFIKKALGKFSPRKCREWFESHNVPLKCEVDNRVFPVSDDGRDVVEVFEDIFAKNRDSITLHYGEGVSVIARNEAIQKQDNDSLGVAGLPRHHSQEQNDPREGREQGKFLITTPKGTYESDILVITTGGNAYSHTGSSGDGYTFARNLGHTITQLGPSLSSFLTKEKWTHELSGLAFENAKISGFRHCEARSNPCPEEAEHKSSVTLGNGVTAPLQKELLELSGPLLLTHFGISGPLTFQLSSHLAWDEIRSKEVLFSPIALMDFTSWNAFLKEQFGEHPKKLITSILTEKLPRRFAEAFVEEYSSRLKETFVASISRDDREYLAKLLGEGILLTLLERRPGDEFVTAGGIETTEINPETMESRIQKNLYFAGEVLNVDAVTGGFNLQACWAGGYVAGRGISEKITQTS